MYVLPTRLTSMDDGSVGIVRSDGSSDETEQEASSPGIWDGLFAKWRSCVRSATIVGTLLHRSYRQRPSATSLNPSPRSSSAFETVISKISQ